MIFVEKRKLLGAATCLDDLTNREVERGYVFSFLYAHVSNKIRKISERILSVF